MPPRSRAILDFGQPIAMIPNVGNVLARFGFGQQVAFTIVGVGVRAIAEQPILAVLITMTIRGICPGNNANPTVSRCEILWNWQ